MISKLRVAMPDRADALDMVKAEVLGATGFEAHAEIQELDGADLVVELRLADSGVSDPGRMARTVERSTRDLDVLGTWNEAGPARSPVPTPCEVVFGAGDETMPAVARRALRDAVPTAQWLPVGEDDGGTGRPQWVLAVPVIQSEGRTVVGLQRRVGYSLRFTACDAAGARVGLAS